jgi:hypothetical protein
MTTNQYTAFTAASNDFNELLIEVVAKRIATLAQTDAAAAANDYRQHITVMTPDEIQHFNHLIGMYAAVLS